MLRRGSLYEFVFGVQDGLTHLHLAPPPLVWRGRRQLDIDFLVDYFIAIDSTARIERLQGGELLTPSQILEFVVGLPDLNSLGGRLRLFIGLFEFVLDSIQASLELLGVGAGAWQTCRLLLVLIQERLEVY